MEYICLFNACNKLIVESNFPLRFVKGLFNL